MPKTSRYKRVAQTIGLDAIDLQRQLHEQTQLRMGKIESRLDKQDAAMEETKTTLAGQNTQLSVIVENTSGLQDLKEKVESIDRDRNRVVGGTKVVGALFGSGLVVTALKAFWPTIKNLW